MKILILTLLCWCVAQAMEPCVVKSIIKIESNGNAKAMHFEVKYDDYSFGLMQIRCSTAKVMGFRGDCMKLLDDETNVYWGKKYLERLSQKYKKLDEIVVAYNAGSVILSKKPGKIYVNDDYLAKFKAAYRECKK